MWKHTILGGVAIVLGVTVTAHAADDTIKTRQAIMDTVGTAAEAGGKMVKGEAPFDARVAQLALRAMNAASYGYGFYFPEGSETGGETEAAPKIWEDRNGFEAELAKFQQASAKAVAAKPADLASFRTSFGEVTQSCKSCHESYRIKKN